MSASAPESAPFTVLIQFEVPPERGPEWLEFLHATIAEAISGTAGFVSATLHLSVDRTTVLNYARWTSRAAWEAASGLTAEGASRVRGRAWDETQAGTWFDGGGHNPLVARLREIGGRTTQIVPSDESMTVLTRVA